MTPFDSLTRQQLDRLLGTHPAAIRTVCWRSTPIATNELVHLELETKQGQVAVFDHVAPVIFDRPPAPAGMTTATRQWRDLTAQLPGAFDGRPLIKQIYAVTDTIGRSTCHHAENRNPDAAETFQGWRFVLSTGVSFEFVLDPTTPELIESLPAVRFT